MYVEFKLGHGSNDRWMLKKEQKLSRSFIMTKYFRKIWNRHKDKGGSDCKPFELGHNKT